MSLKVSPERRQSHASASGVLPADFGEDRSLQDTQDGDPDPSPTQPACVAEKVRVL